MKKIMLMFVISLFYLSCTDATMKQFSSYGSGGEVSCYSGGRLIYQGKSTGKILTEMESDGWYFEEQGSGKLIRVSADCVIRN